VRIASLLLAAASLAACSARGRGRPPDFAVSPEKRAEVVTAVMATLEQHYVFPEKLPELLGQLRERQGQPSFAKLASAHALVDRMNADFREVFHDGHLFLRLAAAFPPEAFEDPDKPDPQAAARMEEQDRAQGFGVAEVRVLEGNVGYLKLRGFPLKSKGESAAYAQAMGKLKDTSALIIDLRQNSGGDGDSVADLVGYFLDKKTLLQDDVERGGKMRPHYSAETVEGPRYGEKRPVYVLTSRRTFSAAEECAYDLQTQKRATVVGEPSGGGANHNRYFRLAQDFALSVPNMTTRNAVTGKNWEGTGVPPDVRVPAAEALEEALRLSRRTRPVQ
jgi:hypothetical protein